MKRLLMVFGLSAALTLPLLAQVRMGAPARPMGPVRVAPMGPVRTMGVPRPVAPRGFSGPVIRRGFAGPTFRTSSPFVFNPACDPFVFQCSPPFISSFNGFRGGRFRRFNRFGRFNRFNQFGFSPFGFSSFGGSPFFGYGYGYPIFSDYDMQVTPQPAAGNPPVVIYAAPPPSERDFEEEDSRSPREAQPQQAAPAKPVEPERLDPVVLIYRDHHREEVGNYAIAGDTLYVFTDHGRRKIALSELDIPATEKANDDRGVDFRVPNERKGS